MYTRQQIGFLAEHWFVRCLQRKKFFLHSTFLQPSQAREDRKNVLLKANSFQDHVLGVDFWIRLDGGEAIPVQFTIESDPHVAEGKHHEADRRGIAFIALTYRAVYAGGKYGIANALTEVVTAVRHIYQEQQKRTDTLTVTQAFELEEKWRKLTAHQKLVLDVFTL